ncbi:hypothetical protein IP92_03254 [Pseudoduganella flava]|nr:hypothetical protein IP92_03254 [Pseudoduganella flava]
MNPLLRWSGPLAAVLLAGCAGMADTSGLSAAGTQGGGAPDEGRQPMCAQHREIMSAKTPAERQALMEEHMKGMTPEMRDRRMEMMRQRCPYQ